MSNKSQVSSEQGVECYYYLHYYMLYVGTAMYYDVRSREYKYSLSTVEPKLDYVPLYTQQTKSARLLTYLHT